MAMRKCYSEGKPYSLMLTKQVLFDWYHPAKSYCAYLPGIIIDLLINKECLHNCNLSNPVAIRISTNVLISSNTKIVWE